MPDFSLSTIGSVLSKLLMFQSLPFDGSRLFLTICFSAALSACLSFSIQPMTAKALMPILGGGPGVWNATMMFYEIALLGGYGYAHLISVKLSPLSGARLHLILLFSALLLLPPLPLKGLDFLAYHEGAEALNAGFYLLLSAGLPFILLSATAPLFQRWACFCSKTPYSLYSYSNAGSFVGLAAYPFLMEPFLEEHDQGKVWSAFFALFALLTAAVSWITFRRKSSNSLLSPTEAVDIRAPVAGGSSAAWKERGLWILLAFTPCSVTLAATSFITAEIGSHPLLWIVPLAVYIGAFSIAFSSYAAAFRRRSMHALPLLVCVALVSLPLTHYLSTLMLLHVLIVLACAGVCCGRLAEQKPETSRLTEFYLFMALGGALGGVFNAVAAPLLFSTPCEYELSVLLALLLRGNAFSGSRKERHLDILIPVAIVVGGMALTSLVRHIPLERAEETSELLGPVFAFCLLIGKVRERAGLLAGCAIAARFLATGAGMYGGVHNEELFHERNFFGVSRVLRDRDSGVSWLRHGTTMHGMQPLDPAYRLSSSVSYYLPATDVINILPHVVKEKPFAVAGLGVGTLACAGVKGQQVDFYEIDPAVIRIAQSPEYFTYLSDCPAHSNIILGDARLKLEQAGSGKYGLIIMDAYNADTLPLHLLTYEAVKMYAKKLSENGILLFHISNRHMKITLPVARIIHEMGWVGRKIRYEPRKDEPYVSISEWIIAAPNEEALGNLARHQEWKQLPDVAREPLWTDSRSSVLRVLLDK